MNVWRRRPALASVHHAIVAPIGAGVMFRLGGETSERQWWDVVGILRVTEDADRAYLRHWAAALNVAELLERALADAAA